VFPLIITHGGNPLVIVSIQHMNNVFISSFVLGVVLKITIIVIIRLYICVCVCVCVCMCVCVCVCKIIIIIAYITIRSDFKECNSIKSLKNNVSATHSS